METRKTLENLAKEKLKAMSQLHKGNRWAICQVEYGGYAAFHLKSLGSLISNLMVMSYHLGMKDAEEIKDTRRNMMFWLHRGDWVLFSNYSKDINSKWKLARYKKTITRKDGTIRHLTMTGKQYKYCLPYEGNEHLIDTTPDELEQKGGSK